MIKLCISFNDADKTVVKASGHSLGMAVGNTVRKLLAAQEAVFDDGEVLFGLSEVIRTEKPYHFDCPEMPENNFDVTLSGEISAPEVATTLPDNATPPSVAIVPATPPALAKEETPTPAPVAVLAA